MLSAVCRTFKLLSSLIQLGVLP